MKFLIALLLASLLIPLGSRGRERRAQASGKVDQENAPIPRQDLKKIPAIADQFRGGVDSTQVICYVPNTNSYPGVAGTDDEMPLVVSELITYTTQDANTRMGFILNDWSNNPLTHEVENVSFTIWWNNPSEVIDAGTESPISEQPDDVIRDIWVYRNTLGVIGAGDTSIIAHYQPETVRGAWVVSTSVTASDWFVIEFQDTFASYDAGDGILRSDLTWSTPVGYDPASRYLTSRQVALPAVGEHLPTWNKFIDADSVIVRYLDPGEYCAANGLDTWLCDLTVMALIWDDSLTQGQQIALENQESIAALAETYQIPAISLAAGIANQANAITRPFDTDFVEKCLLNLPDGPFTGDGASVGVAQITPQEMLQYLPECDDACLFDRQKSFELMAVKLSEANALLPADIDPTERLMVLALVQNNGVGSAEAYLEVDGDWQRLYQHYSQGGYAWDQGDWDQLDKIMQIIIRLLEQGYSLPEGVDLDRWQQVSNSNGQP